MSETRWARRRRQLTALQKKADERAAFMADARAMVEALELAQTALDVLMGDTDIEDDDSDEFKAILAMGKALSTPLALAVKRGGKAGG